MKYYKCKKLIPSWVLQQKVQMTKNNQTNTTLRNIESEDKYRHVKKTWQEIRVLNPGTRIWE